MVEIKVLGTNWKVYLLSEDKYCRDWGDADAAHAIPATQEIYFNEEELTREVVIHEIGHAGFAELCTSSASLTADQTEEVFCDMLAKHGDKLIRLGRKLYRELRNEEGQD